MQGMTRKQLVEIAQSALNLYGITSQKIRLLKTHQYATMFCVEANDRAFALRLFPADSQRLAQAQFEVDLLTALHQDTTLRVPKPKKIIQLQEGLYAVLMTFVRGHHVRKSMNSTHLFKLGEFHALLHNYTAQFNKTNAPRWDWNRIFEPLFNPQNAGWFTQNQIDLFHRTGDIVARSMKALGEDSQVYGLIHSDLHFRNCVFHQGKIGAFDFAECGLGYFLFDMAVTVTELEWEPNKQTNLFKATYLEGYRSVRLLPTQIEQHLPIFIAARMAESATWIFYWTETEQHKYRDDLINFVAETANRLKRFLGESLGK